MADEYKHVKLSPVQQMIASCSGAFMVSLLCKFCHTCMFGPPSLLAKLNEKVTPFVGLS